jgi:hypothetical protein
VWGVGRRIAAQLQAGAIRLGATLAPSHRSGFRAWQMKQERGSPRYTTDWEGLMVVG